MGIHLLLLIYALFSIGFKESNASLAAEVYWKTMLPNTPMPKPLKDLLLLQQPDTRNNKFAESEYDSGDEAARSGYGTGYWSETKEFSKNTIFNKTTVYFLYDDLHPNKNMTLIFTKSMKNSYLLPHRVAESMPFSSNKLLEIFSKFSLSPTSNEARTMQRTIKDCEAPSIEGEEKHCATSLESLVDFVIAKFGKRIGSFSNEAEEENKKQEYTIRKGIKMIGENQIVCHMERYAYAVFYCHIISATKAYMVPLIGSDGSKATVPIICHFNTSVWNPKHIAFQVLGVKPGGSPVCHFLNSDSIVWVPI